MSRSSVSVGASLVLGGCLLSACAKLPTLPENDPLIARGLAAYEAGCVNTAPNFAGVEAAWRALDVPKVAVNKTRPADVIAGALTNDGGCGVGIRGDARATLAIELPRRLRQRGIPFLKEDGKQSQLEYSGIIELNGASTGVAVAGRQISGSGYWTLLLLKPVNPN